MLFAVGIRRTARAVVLGAVLTIGCGGRWLPAQSHDVATQSDPQTCYAAVLEVAAAKKYAILAKDDAAKTARLQAHANDGAYIDVQVYAGDVRLTPAGSLVRDGKVHRALASETSKLETELRQRLGSGPAAAAVPAAAAPAQPAATPTGARQAWNEAAGNATFTCLPAHVPAEHQATLTLQLSNGERADIQLSLAYAPELCRSPAQCAQPGGCPALGIGDTERVTRLASRLSRGEIGAQATLFDGSVPVAVIDLAHHGSIVQAMSELKH